MLRKGAGETGNASGMVFAASGLATLVEKSTGTYSAAKAGIIALAKGLAKENAPDVRANCIAPGAVDTPPSCAAAPGAAATRRRRTSRISRPGWTTAPCWRRSRSAASP